MKKYLIILLSLLSVNAIAQITLKDDSQTLKNEKQKNGKISSNKFSELNGFSKYSGTIQGFSGYCNFPTEAQKVFYEHFMKKISNLNISKEEFDILNNSFKDTAYEVKRDGINGLSCDKFKIEFDKIIKDINQ